MTGLLALPADAVLGVFEEDAFGEEVVADGIGAREVALFFGEGAFGHEGINVGVRKGEDGEEVGVGLVEAAFFFSPGEGGAGVFGVVVVEDGEDLIEEIENGEDIEGVAAAEGAVVSGGVGGADEIEDGGASFGGVEIIGKGSGVGDVCLCGDVGKGFVQAVREGGRGKYRGLSTAQLRCSGRDDGGGGQPACGRDGGGG